MSPGRISVGCVARHDQDPAAGSVEEWTILNTTPMDALAYRFDIVLRGRRSTMFENKREGN